MRGGQRDVLYQSKSCAKGPLAAGLSLPSERKRSQGVRFMFPSRAGAGAAQETPEELHCQDDEHQEPVEKHSGAVCQLVSCVASVAGLCTLPLLIKANIRA